MKLQNLRTKNQCSILSLVTNSMMIFFGDPVTGSVGEMSSETSSRHNRERRQVDFYNSRVTGVDEKDVSIEVKDGVLTLKGERNKEYTEENDNVYRCERSRLVYEVI